MERKNEGQPAQGYVQEFNILATDSTIYNAITQAIPKWWSSTFEGNSSAKGDTFTVRFGNDVFKTIEVTAINPDQYIVWQVKNAEINVPGLINRQEWIGTSIHWGLLPDASGTKLILTHVGLTPEIECYDMCTAGWMQFLTSLKQYCETGTGNPFR